LIVPPHVEYVATHGEVLLALSVTGVDDGESATFEVKKASDHSVLATVEGTIEGGKAVGTWSPDIDVDGDARGVRVYYTVQAGGHSTRAPELEVYLDWIEITSQDQDGKVLVDVPYILKSGPFERRGTTGMSGTHREVDVPPGDVKFEWVGPYELIEWVDQTGPTRKAKLKKLARMGFVWPSPENGNGTRWWMDDGSEIPLHDKYHAHVQLTNHTKTPEHPEWGSRLQCTLSAIPIEQGVSGQKVYVKAVWPPVADRSKRNSPKRELVRGVDKPWAKGINEKGLELALGADGGDVTFEVELGLAGGDTVTLMVGCTPRCEDAKIVVTNQRKVFYQPTVRDGLSVPDLSKAKEYLAHGAVDIDADGPDVVVRAGPAVTGGGAGKAGMTLVPKRWFWDNVHPADPPVGDDMIVGHHNWKHFQEDLFADRQRKGRLALNLVYVDRVVHGTQGDGVSPFWQAFNFVMTSTADSIEPPLIAANGFTIFPRAVHDGGAPVRNVTWRGPATGVPAPLRNKTGVVPESWLAIDTNGAVAFGLAFPEATDDTASEADKVPAQIIAAGGTVTVRGTAYVSSTGFAGWSSEKQIAISDASATDAERDNPGLSAVDLSNSLFCHEVGHNMHQACANDPSWPGSRSFRVPPGMAFNQHPFGYVGHDHVGGHCSFGMATTDRQKHHYNGLAMTERGTCLMYGQLSDPGRLIDTGYCEHCIKFLKGYDMKSVQSI
jgi:hypothetical protein